MTAPNDSLILIGYTQKPYGLFGEVKVQPTSFDFARHATLSTVYFRKRVTDAAMLLEIRSSRADADHWYFKFKDLKTPEAVAHLSGGQLLIPESDKLPLPEDMVYLSDMPGMQVIDINGESIGSVVEVLEQGAQELLVVATPKKEIHIPWNDHFVKKVDKVVRIVEVDLSMLRNIL
jgi:16S rRNA processing protein RimM